MRSVDRQSGSLPLVVYSFASNLVHFMFQLLQALMHLVKIVVDNAGEDGAGFFIELIVGPEQRNQQPDGQKSEYEGPLGMARTP